MGSSGHSGAGRFLLPLQLDVAGRLGWLVYKPLPSPAEPGEEPGPTVMGPVLGGMSWELGRQEDSPVTCDRGFKLTFNSRTLSK